MARPTRPLVPLVAGIAVVALLPSLAAAQATRTWISGVGDDANPCSRTAPCKTIAGAISKTADGGEINAIDPGGFGAATITKSLTIDFSNVLGGVLATGTNGISIATSDPTDTVVLRGLDIVGPGVANGGASSCNSPMLSGVNITKAGSVTISDSRIINASQAAVKVAPTAGAPDVTIDGVQVHGDCNTGVGVLGAPGAGLTSNIAIRNSVITGTTSAVRMATGATAWLSGSTIFGNGVGLDAQGGTINLFSDTRVYGNGVDGTPTNTLGATGAQGPAGGVGPQGAQGPAGPAGEAAPPVIIFRARKVVVRGARPVLASYVASASGRGVLTVTRTRKVVVRKSVKVQAGVHGVVWNGRIGREPAAPGSYTLGLQVTNAGGVGTASTGVAVR